MAFDEMRGNGKGKRCREPYRDIASWLESQPSEELARKGAQAEAIFRRTGITFAVYGSQEAGERLIPFDIIPRILSAAEWRRLCEVREWRLTGVISPVESGGLSLEELCEFRSVGDRLVPYRPMQLLDAGQKAIETVVLRPRNVSLSEHVSAMLRKHGFHDIEVKRSSATYR